MSFQTESYANTAKTILSNLEKRNMKGYYCENAEEARKLIQSLIPAHATVTWGGSETLVETGIMDTLKQGDYILLDRKEAKTPEESGLSMAGSSLQIIFSPAPMPLPWTGTDQCGRAWETVLPV